jgi:uncharacterized protein (TIGR03066 family)
LGNRPGADGAGRPSQRPERPNNPQERRDNLQDRLSSRDEFRDQNREDRQANRDEVRQDWQDRYEDIYNNHDDWHHGNWHGNYGDWWEHMWDDHTALMAFGTTMWGLNAAAYGFGYWGYSNPYYTESYPVGGESYIDYSQPIAIESAAVMTDVAPTTTTLPADVQPAAAPAPGMTEFEMARQAFYRGDYPGALAATNKALAAMPNDPIIHEFRALVQFAQGNYQEAAAGLYSVLTVGPGWDWTTLSSLYPSVDIYTKQLRALEDYIKQRPQANDARFVLAYHYLTTNNKDAATAQLKELNKQTPQDPLIAQLLLMTGGPDALGVPPEATETTVPDAPAVPAADLVGNWTAKGERNTKFAMELSKDGNFSWTFTEKGKPQTVKGVYAVDGNVLAMEPESGGTMLAEVTQPKADGFEFKMLGAPPGDKGLKFVKGG